MRHRKKMTGESEIDLKPFMNVIVTLIPVLLISANYAKIAIINLKLPENRASATAMAGPAPKIDDNSNKLLLSAIVTDSVVTLGARGGFMPPLRYREFDKYVAKDTHDSLTVEFKAGQKVRDPKTGRELSIYEREEVFLYVVDDKKNIIKTLYTDAAVKVAGDSALVPPSVMVTDADGNAVQSAKPGETVYLLTNPRKTTVVRNPNDFVLKELSAYDELKNRLMKVKDRFRDVDDSNDVIIAAGNNVIYDKIVQIMDVAREAHYPNISIAKLRM